MTAAREKGDFRSARGASLRWKACQPERRAGSVLRRAGNRCGTAGRWSGLFGALHEFAGGGVGVRWMARQRHCLRRRDSSSHKGADRLVPDASGSVLSWRSPRSASIPTGLSSSNPTRKRTCSPTWRRGCPLVGSAPWSVNSFACRWSARAVAAGGRADGHDGARGPALATADGGQRLRATDGVDHAVAGERHAVGETCQCRVWGGANGCWN